MLGSSTCEDRISDTDWPPDSTGVKGLVRADKFPSVHRDASKSKLEDFSLVPLFAELSEHAPILTAVLTESCPSKKSDEQKKLAVVVSSAVLLKFQNPKMKLIAAIFSLVLQAGHAGRQVRIKVCVTNHRLMYLMIYLGIQTDAKDHDHTFIPRNATVVRLSRQRA